MVIIERRGSVLFIFFLPAWSVCGGGLPRDEFQENLIALKRNNWLDLFANGHQENGMQSLHLLLLFFSLNTQC